MLWVRSEGSAARSTSPADLVASREDDERTRADTLVALEEAGPFEKLGVAIERDDRLRELLAKTASVPCLRGWPALRFVLLAALAPPVVAMLELDRELVFAHAAGSSRIFVDLVLAAFLVFELTRKTPRLPGIAALAATTIGLRWALVPARLCAREVHPLVYAAAAACVAGALVLLVRVPSRARVSLEVLDKLGIARWEWLASKRREEPSGAIVGASLAAAVGLPALLHFARVLHASFPAQAALVAVYGIVVPYAARRLEPAEARPPIPPARTILAIASGLALVAGIVTAANVFFDAGTEVARCVNRLDVEARHVLALRSSEVGTAVESVRSSTSLVLLTALVFPFAEERIYRGLLQDTLVRRYGGAYGIFASSVVFGLAHLGVYQVALYQTFLLGLGFGFAYAEGGFIAALMVHATWNLILLS